MLLHEHLHGPHGKPPMDLRYLEFLLASYSWAVIVFAAIMVLWLVLNNITEIAVASTKVKPRIAVRTGCPDAAVLDLHEYLSSRFLMKFSCRTV
jgi:hypothetical protein